MITTITLNPALDKRSTVEDFVMGDVNEILEINVSPGGKGIIVSDIVKKLGVETTALGIVGGNIGKELVDLLDEKDIGHDFVWVNGETRTNLKIYDTNKKTCTEILEPGPFINSVDIEELFDKIEIYMSETDFFVISGDVQKNLKTNIYNKIIKHIKKLDPEKKIILDADGKFLEEGIKANPWMIKPNLNELSEYAGKKIEKIGEVIEESKKIVDSGVSYVCTSMGENGIVFVTSEKSFILKVPKVEAIDYINPGEVLVSSILVGLIKGENDLEDNLRNACAHATSSVTDDKFDFSDKKLIEKIYNEIEIEIVKF